MVAHFLLVKSVVGKVKHLTLHDGVVNGVIWGDVAHSHPLALYVCMGGRDVGEW